MSLKPCSLEQRVKKLPGPNFIATRPHSKPNCRNPSGKARRGAKEHHTYADDERRECHPSLSGMGDHDRVIPPEEGREMARQIPDAQIVTITGTGHLSYLERPEIFNELVLRFLDCSEAASFVTGIALAVDGGYVAQ